MAAYHDTSCGHRASSEGWAPRPIAPCRRRAEPRTGEATLENVSPTLLDRGCRPIRACELLATRYAGGADIPWPREGGHPRLIADNRARFAFLCSMIFPKNRYPR